MVGGCFVPNPDAEGFTPEVVGYITTTESAIHRKPGERRGWLQRGYACKRENTGVSVLSGTAVPSQR